MAILFHDDCSSLDNWTIKNNYGEIKTNGTYFYSEQEKYSTKYIGRGNMSQDIDISSFDLIDHEIEINLALKLPLSSAYGEELVLFLDMSFYDFEENEIGGIYFEVYSLYPNVAEGRISYDGTLKTFVPFILLFTEGCIYKIKFYKERIRVYENDSLILDYDSTDTDFIEKASFIRFYSSLDSQTNAASQNPLSICDIKIESREALPLSCGRGTEESPFQIWNEKDLIHVKDHLDSHFIQMANLDLEDYYFSPIGSQDNYFTGIYDGGYFSISNLSISTMNFYSGLFGLAAEATFKNINIRNCLVSEVYNPKYQGALLGGGEDVTIINCSSNGKVISSSNSGRAGGLIGVLWNSHIENCYSHCYVKGYWAGGLIVEIQSTTVQNCYSAGIVEKVGDEWSNAGGLISYDYDGEDSNSIIINSYYDSDISELYDTDLGEPKTTAEMKELSTYINWDFEETWNIDSDVNNGYPYLQGEQIVHEFEFGDGTEDNPYQIWTIGDLNGIRKDYYENVYFKQMVDFDLSAYDNWVPIGKINSDFPYFLGNYDGNGHIISNMKITRGLKINNDDDDKVFIVAGFFGLMFGTIKNLGFINYNITPNKCDAVYAYPLCLNQGVVENCFAKGSIEYKQSADAVFASGLCFNADGKTSNCYAICTADIDNGTEGASILGGISGVGANGYFTNCYSVLNPMESDTDYLLGIGIIDEDSLGTNYYNSDFVTSTDEIEEYDGLPRTTIQMKQKSTYEGWDFDTIWNIDGVTNDGYPFLRGQAVEPEEPEEPEERTEGFLTYRIENNEAIIIKCDVSASGELIIPSELSGYPVTTLNRHSFYNCIDLTSIIMPNSIATIGRFCFSNCTNLKKIVISENVRGIPFNCFRYCSSLEDITFPSNVTYIGELSFVACIGLKNIFIPSTVEEIDIWAFGLCDNLEKIYVLSPDVIIYDNINTFPSNAVIYGYNSSTAEAYADKYNRMFVSLDYNYIYGDGTKTNPYEIRTIEDLNRVRYHLDACFVQMNDIDLSEIDWIPIGYSVNYNNYFHGVYNGKGHIINGLSFDESITDCLGLFSIAKGATIKNLGITNITVSAIANHTVGGLAGALIDCSISNCYTTGEIGGVEIVGGFAGAIENCNIKDCYSMVDVYGFYYIGGFAGYSPLGVFDSCYSAGIVSGEMSIGGFIAGYSLTETLIINCYYDSTMSNLFEDDCGIPKSTEDMKKEETYNDWDFGHTWSIDEGLNNGYPFLNMLDSKILNSNTSINQSISKNIIKSIIASVNIDSNIYNANAVKKILTANVFIDTEAVSSIDAFDFGQELVKPELYLCKPNRDIIYNLQDIYDVNLEIKLGQISELSFVTPYMIEIDHELVDNPYIEYLKHRYLIKFVLDNYIEWFMIDIPTSDSSESSDIKEVACLSLGYELADKILKDYTVTSYNARQLLVDVLKDTTWSVGYIDAEFDLMYRSIEGESGTVLDLIFKIAETFDGIIKWDTVNRVVNLYSYETIGFDRGLILDYGRYLKTINQTLNPEAFCTRLYLTGKNGAIINSVNPTGMPYVESFDYFLDGFTRDDNKNVLIHSSYMSDELCNAILDYEDLIQSKESVFSNLLTQLEAFQETLLTKQGKLYDLNGELTDILDSIDITQSVGGSALVYLNQKTEKQSEINIINSEINSLTNSINNIINQITQLSDEVSIKNNFSSRLITEMNQFIIEKEVSNEYISSPKQLLDWGEKQLSKLIEPQLIIDLDIINFLQCLDSECIIDRDKFYLGGGDTVAIRYEKFNIDIKATIAEISINFENDDIKLVISNVQDIRKDKEKFLDKINKAMNTNMTVDMNKYKWNGIESTANDVNILINNIWDSTREKLNASVNEFVGFGRQGILITTPDKPSDLMRITSGVIGLSKDGGNSYKTAISADGVVAERLIGKILIGQNLIIDASNSEGKKFFTVNENGVTIDGMALTITGGLSSSQIEGGDWVELEKEYGGITIDSINGLVAVSEKNNALYKTTLNASEGIKIEKSTDNGQLWASKFYVDNTGELAISGNFKSGTITISQGSSVFKADYQGIYLGNTEFNKAPFRVTGGGALYARNVDIEGIIDCSGLFIDGQNILTNNKINGNHLTNLDASTIKTGTLEGIILKGNTIIGGTIKTKENGLRLEMSSNKFASYNTSNNYHGIVIDQYDTSFYCSVWNNNSFMGALGINESDTDRLWLWAGTGKRLKIQSDSHMSIESKNGKCYFAGEVDFSGATVTGLSGGGGVAVFG